MRENFDEASLIPLQNMSDLPNRLHHALASDKNARLHHVNDRGHNWLMTACENGWTNMVLKLIAEGFDVDSTNGQDTAIELAYSRGYFDTVLALLRNNAKFPKNFKPNKTHHGGLIEFAQTTAEFFKHLRKRNVREMRAIADRNQHIKHFYCHEAQHLNHSASFVAIACGLTDSYEECVSLKLTLAPDEDYQTATKPLSQKKLKDIYDVHKRHGMAMPSSHITRMSNSVFASGADELELAREVLAQLDREANTQRLMHFVTRVGDFRLIFDFDRRTTERGMAQARGGRTTHHILIGAADLLNNSDSDRREVGAAIVNRLCVFAMDLLYDNNGLPFRPGDAAMERIFRGVLDHCQRNRAKETLIDRVFNENQDENEQLANITAVVPQIMTCYAKERPKADRLRSIFATIFGFYTDSVHPGIERNKETIRERVEERRMKFLGRKWKKKPEPRKLPWRWIVGPIAVCVSIALCGLLWFILSREKELLVIGGEPTEFKAWPWVAPLFYDGKYICSATLISESHLLTAAQCVKSKDHEKYHTFINEFDKLNGNYSLKAHYISTITEHENHASDIAILQLVESVSIKAISLPKPSFKDINIDSFAIGFKSSDIRPLLLKFENITNCQSYHDDLCASNQTASLCTGGLGGGLFRKKYDEYIIYGVASQTLSNDECKPGDVSVFIDVTKHLFWIHKTITKCAGTEDCVNICDFSRCGVNARCSTEDNRSFKCSCESNTEGDPNVECTTIKPFDLDFANSLISVLRHANNDFDRVVEEFQLQSYVNGQIKLLDVKRLSQERSNSFASIPQIDELLAVAANFKTELPQNAKSIHMKIQSFIKPLDVNPLASNGIVELKRKVMTSRDLRDEFFETYEEIRVICDTLHVNDDLPAAARGKNLVVFANDIVVHSNIVWNLSGKDGNGLQTGSLNGNNGESGGNCVIVCRKSFHNSDLLRIVSNGGIGARGNDVSRGIDGFNGDNAERVDFDVHDDRKDTYDDFISSDRNRKRTFVFLCRNEDIFKLIFVRGSDGTNGTSGGLGGLGGSDGRPGQITIEHRAASNVKIERRTGSNGSNGSSGENGKNGLNGRDAYRWLSRTMEFIKPVGLETEERFDLLRTSDPDVKSSHTCKIDDNTFIYPTNPQVISTTYASNDNVKDDRKLAVEKPSIDIDDIKRRHKEYLDN